MKSTNKAQRLKNETTVIPPLPAVYRRPEANPFLHQMKAQVVKKLNFRYRSVFCQRDLAISLLALERDADALRIVDYAHGNVQFRGKYDVWYTAASAGCVAAHIRRKKGEHQKATRTLQRYIDQPAHGLLTQPEVWTPAFVRKHINDERVRFKREFANPKAAFAVEAMAWWTATLIFFREMAVAGFPRRNANKRFLDASLPKALKQLKDKLQSFIG